MSKWKFGCGGLVAVVVVVLAAVGGWFVYQWLETTDIQFENEGTSQVTVSGELYCDTIYLEPGETQKFETETFLCGKSDLTISSPTIGKVVCTWQEAREERVVVTDTSVSCYPHVIPTPPSPPISPPPAMAP